MGADRVREARLQTLMDDFHRLRMKETDTIDEFSGRLAELSSRSASLGEIIEEPRMVKKFLSSLPKSKYITIIAALKQVLNLNTTSFEDIVGQLKAYEERIKIDEDPQEDQGKLMYANHDQESYSRNRDYQETSGRGRGRGGRFANRGRDRGRWNNHREGRDTTRDWKDGRDTSRVVCFRCDKTGHYAYNCPDRLLKLQETHENDDESTRKAEELMMNEIVYLTRRT